MHCPACARPIASARASCIYCGAALSAEGLEEAAQAAQRILRSKSLENLEAAAKGLDRDRPKRRYVVIDTTVTAEEIIAAACSVSVWEARQWRAASRFRLVRVSQEPAEGPLESSLRAKGLRLLVVPDDTVARARNPVSLESIDTSAEPSLCTIREDPEGAPTRRELRDENVNLIVSASIKRERVKDQASLRVLKDRRLEEAWLVHLHLKGEQRPWEVDPLRTAYEGAGMASAYMRTLELVRRLSAIAPHDEAFRNIVPALSPGLDPQRDLEKLAPNAKQGVREPKVVVLDNVAQFREYSAWRGAIEASLQQDREPLA